MESSTSKAQQRRIALGAARSQLRRMGAEIDPALPFEDVLKVLDNLCRSEPDLLASRWYREASEHQVKQLRREWQRQFHDV
jgi:outer membrane protein TolC